MEELTTSQAVKAYGVFPSVIHRMILMGRLDARRDERGFWHITRESLERWDKVRTRRNSCDEGRGCRISGSQGAV